MHLKYLLMIMYLAQNFCLWILLLRKSWDRTWNLKGRKNHMLGINPGVSLSAKKHISASHKCSPHDHECLMTVHGWPIPWFIGFSNTLHNECTFSKHLHPWWRIFITVFLKHHLYSKIRIWVFSCLALLMILHFVIFLFLLHKIFLQKTSITWCMAAKGNLGPYEGAGESINMLSNGHIP